MRQLLDSWAQALTGPRRHRAVILGLIAYGAIWTVYRIVATQPRDIHFDMSELYSWSRSLDLGYEKHPPLGSWIVAAWFSVVPVYDWAFTLLAIANICVSLYIVWCILERWTDPRKAAFGLAMLTLSLFYNFHSLKYNANTVLLPFWAFTAYAFLRAFEQRSVTWGALAGAGAAAAMMGKYWSIFLIAGLGSATLLDPRRRSFFASPAPWVTLAVGAMVLSPHLLWLSTHHYASFAYAGARANTSLDVTVWSVLKYLGDIAAYCALPVVIWAWCLRPSRAALVDSIAPYEPQQRLALLSFALPHLLPVLVALAFGLKLTGLWTLPGYALLPMVLLASPLISVGREALQKALAVSALYSLGALVMSPCVALWLHTHTTPRASDHASVLAANVAARWQTNIKTPLPLISGDPDLAMAVGYALKLPSRVFNGDAPALSSVILQEGAALVCEADDLDCMNRASEIAALRKGSLQFAEEDERPLYGIPGRTVRYAAFLIPPP